MPGCPAGDAESTPPPDPSIQPANLLESVALKRS
jgi:hypothetical protein